MKNLLIAGALALLIVGGVVIVGCGPRGEVAQDKILEQIDKVLGELNVKQKSIEMQYDKLRDMLEKVRLQRIETGVRLERITAEKEAKESELAEIEGNLQRLRPLIAQARDSESGVFVNDNGVEFSLDELTRRAKSLMDQHGDITRVLENRIASQFKVLTDSNTMMVNQESVTKEQLDALKDKIEEIDEKKKSVEALRATSEIAGTTSINDELAALNEQVDEMLIDLDVATAQEQEKLNELIEEATAEVALGVDDIFEGSAEEADNVLSDLDAIIGGGE